MLAATHWRLRTRTLDLTAGPLVMGIVNVTPDSFSDGGRYVDATHAVEHALGLVAAGADILDIGGESTRPAATPVTAAEELSRVLPVLRELRDRVTVPLSIDTSKALVARAAIDQGVEIINDVTGLAGDPDMLPLAVATSVGVCAMHMRGTPATMQDDPQYMDVTAEIHDYLRQRRDELLAAGVAWQRICLDPGIGFGKTHGHNMTLLQNMSRFHELGCPLLVGHSRKGFISKAIRQDRAVRGLPADASLVSLEQVLGGTIGVACALAAAGVQIIRVHDVTEVRAALLLYQSLMKH
ncbi:MAG: dihydropteroate synthase [Pirellulales bacterium]|nr:dihydropteroate synthase [Pirellulales bacterium]